MSFPFTVEAYEIVVEDRIKEFTTGRTQEWLLDLFSQIQNATDYVQFSTFPNCYTITLEGMKISVPSKKLNAGKRRDEDLIEENQIEAFKNCLEILYFFAYTKLVSLLGDGARIWDEELVSELVEIENKFF